MADCCCEAEVLGDDDVEARPVTTAEGICIG